MSRRSVPPIILAGFVSFTLWGWVSAQGPEAAPPPVNPPSSENPFEDEGPKTEKKPAAKEEAEEKSDKKPEDEKVIREEVEPIVVPAPTPAKKEPVKKDPVAPKGENPKASQPVPKKPEVEETKPVEEKPTVVDEAPAAKTPAAKTPAGKKPVEAGKPVHRDEREGGGRPAPLAPHHKSTPRNEVEIERSVYRAGNGTFHLAGEVGTAHYEGSDGKTCLAVLHLMGPSSPNPPFVLPESDANYLYYYQDASCGDATVMAWAFQKPVPHSEGLWVMKYVQDGSGKKSWVAHGGAQRVAIGCLPRTGTDCRPVYDPPAPGESPRPNPPPAQKGGDDLPVSPGIRFDPLEAEVPRTPRSGGHIIFRAE